jgi:hypothetical protein
MHKLTLVGGFAPGDYYFVCSAAAVPPDCPTDATKMVSPASVIFSASASPDGVLRTRLEYEPGPTPPLGWYLRAVRTTTGNQQSTLVNGVVSVDFATVAGMTAGKTDKAYISAVRPSYLGTRVDHYPLSWNGGTVSLEDIVLRNADANGIPPQFLMSHIAHEAWPASIPPNSWNTYAYRYEPYAFDFLYITGDGPLCCYNGTHLFLDSSQPFLVTGLIGNTAVFRPASGVDAVPDVVADAVLDVVSGSPNQLRIKAGPNGPPVEWNVQIDDTAPTGLTYTRVAPGANPQAETEFTVDCRSGLITFGAEPPDSQYLRVTYRPARNVTVVAGALGSALGGAPSTDQIRSGCINCPSIPPTGGTMPQLSISGWARAGCNGSSLTQDVARYGMPFTTAQQKCALLSEDPSFDVQAQWYAAASFGLMQMWPANAETLIRHSNQSSVLRALFNPRTTPGSALFDPTIGVAFGAAADGNASVRTEIDPTVYSYEPTCPVASQTTVNACTWNRYWARVFTSYKTGNDNPSASTFTGYGWPIVVGGDTYVPVP